MNRSESLSTAAPWLADPICGECYLTCWTNRSPSNGHRDRSRSQYGHAVIQVQDALRLGIGNADAARAVDLSAVEDGKQAQTNIATTEWLP